MKIVIQCAGRKDPAATSLAAEDGRPVLFIAHPADAPPSLQHAYARPDDLSENGQTWRERLLDHNEDVTGNPHRLLPAYRLYADEVYRALVEGSASDQVVILSAGWGLIPAGFPTPLVQHHIHRAGRPVEPAAQTRSVRGFLHDSG